jgi:hypothetical protein
MFRDRCIWQGQFRQVSLLNHILGTEVLPVGVTPVTAIPTRVIFGPEPAIDVSFAIGRQERLGIERLPEFVTEQQNKGNDKQVTRIVVEFPSRRLEDGIVFVDTPGLGSLATAGAAETLAYLPRCDLGVLLVDSASTLTEDDVGTIRMLLEVGIPASILLSKADLIEPEDRERAVAYTKEKIRERLGVGLPVIPVSVAPSDAILLDLWFDAEIAPVYARHRELARQSIRRKIGLLRESVASALRMALGRDLRADSPLPEALQRAGHELRAATGAFDDAWRRGFQLLDRLREAPDLVVAGLAHEAAALIRSSGQREIESEWLRSASQRIAAEQLRDLPKILAKLALDSAHALNECARDLNTSEAPNPAEFASAVQEMPLIDIGSIESHLHAGILARTWNGSAVRGFLDLLLGQFRRIRRMAQHKVAPARLHLITRNISRQRDFQRVKTAVQLQILRRESEHIDEFGLRGDSFESFPNIVVVVNERAPGGIRQVTQHIFVGHNGVIQYLILLVGGDHGGRRAHIASVNHGKEAARVQRIDRDIGANGPVDNIVLVGPVIVGQKEPGRDHDDVPAAGERAHPPHQSFQCVQREARIAVADIQRARGEPSYGRLGLRHGLRDALRGRELRIWRRRVARHVLGFRDLQRLLVILVKNQVSLVVLDTRTARWTGGDGRGRPNLKQCLMQNVAVVGEIERGPARSREDDRALQTIGVLA